MSEIIKEKFRVLLELREIAVAGEAAARRKNCKIATNKLSSKTKKQEAKKKIKDRINDYKSQA